MASATVRLMYQRERDGPSNLYNQPLNIVLAQLGQISNFHAAAVRLAASLSRSGVVQYV